MNIIYTNISPVTNSYANFNHLILLKKYNVNKVIICVWDSFVYETKIFRENLPKHITKEEKLQQNVANIEKLLSYLGIDYRIIYFSNAWDRMFKNSRYSLEFQKILANIELEDINKHNIKYSPIGRISIAKMHYIIADFLFALNLPLLFPEICNTVPNVYLTSERFKLFKEPILNAINYGSTEYKIPRIKFVDYVPVIMALDGKMPSLETSSATIKKIFLEYLEKKTSNKEIYELLNMLGHFDQKFSYGNRKYNSLEFTAIVSKLGKLQKVEVLSRIMHNYLLNIRKILHSTKYSNFSAATFISSINEFKEKIKPLNGLKIAILQKCNGCNSSSDIAKAIGLKLSTVSTYLTHLKNSQIITNTKRPNIVSDKFVIDLKNMEVK